MSHLPIVAEFCSNVATHYGKQFTTFKTLAVSLREIESSEFPRLLKLFCSW